MRAENRVGRYGEQCPSRQAPCARPLSSVLAFDGKEQRVDVALGRVEAAAQVIVIVKRQFRRPAGVVVDGQLAQQVAQPQVRVERMDAVGERERAQTGMRFIQRPKLGQELRVALHVAVKGDAPRQRLFGQGVDLLADPVAQALQNVALQG